MKLRSIVTLLALTILAGSSSTVFSQSGECRSDAFPAISYQKEAVFPADLSLNRPEDGKALLDGRIIVADQEAGLRLVNEDGSSRPFGRMSEAGYENSAETVSAPNGVHLESDRKHLLVSDVYRGVIYRVDMRRGTTKKIYEHTSGVNVAISDRNGNIWFSQSAENPRPNGHETLYAAIDKAYPTGKIFFLKMKGEAASGEAREVAAGLFFANGIDLSPDQKTLYAAETMANRVLAFDVDLEEGKLSSRRVATTVMTPDNLSVDDKGNVWVVSPVTNSVYALDSRCGSLHRVFSAQSDTNSMAAQKWAEALVERKSLMALFSPDAWKPLPGGFITGLFFSADGKTLYITGLGKAILRYKVR